MGADICNGHPWLNRFQEGLMDKDGRKGPQAALVNSGCREVPAAEKCLTTRQKPLPTPR